MGKSLKGRELGKGLSQRPDGTYEGRFVNRFGKRQSVYGKTITEVTQKLRDAQISDDNMLNIVDSNITLDEWYEKFISVYKKHCRNTTIRTYNTEYNSLKPFIGHLKLKDIKLITLQTVFNKLKSDSLRKRCRSLLVDIFEEAIRNELITKNVATGIKTKIAQKNEEERRVLSDKEVELLLSVIVENCYMYHLIVIGLNTGMRLGEMLGLCWDCVDFENNEITVRRNMIYLPNNGEGIYELHEPKTASGRRMIPMLPVVKNSLLVLKRRKEIISNRHLPVDGMEDLVFASKMNRPINEANVRSSIRYYLKKIESRGETMGYFTPHCLRHTFTTNCIKKGVTPKTLQKVLGHAHINITLDIYCHIDKETIKNEMFSFLQNGVKMA